VCVCVCVCVVPLAAHGRRRNTVIRGRSDNLNWLLLALINTGPLLQGYCGNTVCVCVCVCVRRQSVSAATLNPLRPKLCFKFLKNIKVHFTSS